LGLILNPKKSGIVEFRGRRKRLRWLDVGEEIEGIMVMKSYRYLGLIMDEKLTVHSHLAKMKEKLLLQAEALGKVIFNFSAGYRKNLWMLLVRPLFDFPALLCMAEEGKSNVEMVERLCRKSFKRMVGVAPQVKNEIVEMFAGYNLRDRGRRLWDEAEVKWDHRRMRLKMVKRIDVKVRSEDLLMYIPGEAIKMVNLYSRMCPVCVGKRMKPDHLRVHGLEVPEPTELLKKINEGVIAVKRSCSQGKKRFERVKSLKIWGDYCDGLVRMIMRRMYGRMEIE
jgi:hypothetical protein